MLRRKDVELEIEDMYENARKMTKEEFNQFLEDMRMRAYNKFWKIKWPCPYCGRKFETEKGCKIHIAKTECYKTGDR